MVERRGTRGWGAIGESGNRGRRVHRGRGCVAFALVRPGSPAKGGQESGKGEDKRDARVYLFAYIWFAYVLVG